jgi:hypothetical protein
MHSSPRLLCALFLCKHILACDAILPSPAMPRSLGRPPTAESSELLRRNLRFGPPILHLLGKGQRAIAIVVAGVGADADANANADAGADVRLRVAAPAVPLPLPQSRASTASVTQQLHPRDCCPRIGHWRQRRLSSLPCGNPKIPCNRTHSHSPPLSCCNPVVVLTALTTVPHWPH